MAYLFQLNKPLSLIIKGICQHLWGLDIGKYSFHVFHLVFLHLPASCLPCQNAFLSGVLLIIKQAYLNMCMLVLFSFFFFFWQLNLIYLGPVRRGKKRKSFMCTHDLNSKRKTSQFFCLHFQLCFFPMGFR